MNAHVDHQRRVMFVESAEAAQKRLEALVKQVEAMMSERVMEVFVAMRRDYRSVLGGAEETQGELLPKAERLMRKDLRRILDDIERMFTNVLDAKVEENADLKEEDVKNERLTIDEFEDSNISDQAFNSLNDRKPDLYVPASEEEPSAAFSANNSHPPPTEPSPRLEPSDTRNLAASYETEEEQPSSPFRDSTPAHADN